MANKDLERARVWGDIVLTECCFVVCLGNEAVFIERWLVCCHGDELVFTEC